MTDIGPYQETIEYLYSLQLFGTKLGLDNILELSRLAGNPHHRLRFIHVAGTNGKGSTCAILESIYRASGLRVGLFTSPHLVSFRERIQVNREWVSETEVVSLAERMRSLLSQLPPDRHPTFFEIITVMALCCFEEQRCDLVIWETGLGGRLDATNIVTPLASVITNIQYDHQKWLGESLSNIASEKAGIIKPRIPVITGVDEPAAWEVIARTASAKGSRLIKVEPDRLEGESANLPLMGRHQLQNLAVALATIHTLQDYLPVSEEQMQTGLASVIWPGRLQLVTRSSGQKILLDGAHNIAGAKALAAAVKSRFPCPIPALVLGILCDKDWKGMCQTLAPLTKRLVVVPVSSARSALPEELAEICRQSNPGAQTISCGSLEEALRIIVEDPFVGITGSLYLVGEAMELLGLLPAGVSSERGLNDWQAAGKREPR